MKNSIPSAVAVWRSATDPEGRAEMMAAQLRGQPIERETIDGAEVWRLRPTRKLFLDGTLNGDTYFVESEAQAALYVNGHRVF